MWEYYVAHSVCGTHSTPKVWHKNITTPSDGYVPTSPGEVVSVDQLESNVAGLIAEMAGCPTVQCHKVVAVFVDHATGFSFVYFQRTSSAKEIVQGKSFLNNMLQALGTR